MCSSDKQNMGGIKIENVVVWLVKSLTRENPRRNTKVNDIEKERAKLKELVEKERGYIDNKECLDSTFIGNLIDAEYYGDAIDYLFHNKLIEGQDLEQIKSYLDEFIKQLNDPKPERSTNQSSGPNIINIQPGNVRRCLLFLFYFPEHFFFNLKRVTRLSVPNEVIPENLEKLSEFLDIIGEPFNHYLLNSSGRTEVQTFPEWDRKPCLKGIKSEPNRVSYPSLVFEVGTNINELPNFQQWKFMFLRYLSLREVIMEEGKFLDLNKLSSLKYLDLKHTKVKDCSWFECLEKLQMLDLRYTHVKEIPDNILEKFPKLQHLLLGYIDESKKNGKNQLVGPKFIKVEKDPKFIKVEKLEKTNLKTLRAIEQPENIKEISHFSNVVDLSVTGLREESLKTFWGTLETFHNLTSLGVAVTHPAVIKLEDCRGEPKKKLKRLRMEGSHSGLEKLGEFGKLNDLTLANMGIAIIPDLPELLCLRLYGVCQEATCKFELKMFGNQKKLVVGDMEMVETVQISSAVFETVQQKMFGNLKKLVIGDMGMVETVQISSAVLDSAVTLKFSNLPKLKEVYTGSQNLLLKWRTSTAVVPFREVQPNTTIFFRDFENFPVENSPGLKIYHYNLKMQCYSLQVKCNTKQ